MAIRLAIIGAVLVVGGLVDLGGFGTYVVPAGGVVLVAAGVLWLARRRSTTRG
jgi:hypothetical protein